MKTYPAFLKVLAVFAITLCFFSPIKVNTHPIDWSTLIRTKKCTCKP